MPFTTCSRKRTRGPSRGCPRAVDSLALQSLVAAFATGRNLVDDLACEIFQFRDVPGTRVAYSPMWTSSESNAPIRSRKFSDHGRPGKGVRTLRWGLPYQAPFAP